MSHYAKTALISIDMQKMVLSRALAPHNAEQVTENILALARAINQGGGIIVQVITDFSADLTDLPPSCVDSPLPIPPGGLPADVAEVPVALRELPVDVRITKRQWSAFFGTELDLQLRRRGIEQVVVAGVATNFGVESTARDAWQHNYAVLIPNDAATSFNSELHQFSIANVMPRISRVRATAELLKGLGN